MENIWDNMKQLFVAPNLDMSNYILMFDSRDIEAHNSETHSYDLWLFDCLTQPEPDFWTLCQKYSLAKNEIVETYKMRTDHFLFWLDCYNPNLSANRNSITDLIQKSCMSLSHENKLTNEEFETFYSEYENQIADML
jgi:hypothetical protein